MLGDLGDLLFSALEHVPCGIVVASTSADGRILWVSSEFTAITGYTHADVPTVQDWLERAYPDPDYRARVAGNWERDVSEPGRDVFYVVRRANGQDREMLLRAGLLGEQRMIVALLDVTEVRRVERELRASEERFRQIAQNVDQVFWVHGIRPEVMEYASPAFERIWGRPVSVLDDDPAQWLATVVEPDRPRVEAEWARALAGEAQTVEFEYRIRRPDGELRWIEDQGAAIRDDAGEIIRLVGIAKDITDRKRAEAAERELEQQTLLAQKMESLGVLAGGVAHDFNNLLVGVLGHADLALADLPPASPARESVEAVVLAARRAADLAGQLLAYSGRGKFVVSRLDLRELVQEMAQLMGAAIPKQTTVRYDLGPTPATIEGDASQVRQVVMNLLTNAADAVAGSRGTIRVATGSLDVPPGGQPAAALHGRELPPGPCSYVEVSDTGPGMDEAACARIFDPFFTTKATGRGLGLAAVIGIVKAHRGAIEVESEPGQGSRFRVYFPGTEAEAEVTEAGDEEGRIDRPEPRGAILVVDDEEIVRDVVARYLRRIGYDVLLAPDGRAAIEIFRGRRAQIDGVFLDLSMPTLDGPDTHRELRRIDPEIRILLSSGFTAAEAVETITADPLTEFIQKPFSSKALGAALDRLLGDRSGSHDTPGTG